MQTQLIKISKLKTNTGQIDGLPKNPRLIKDDKYRKLVQSLKDDPEMLELRELIVYPNDNVFVVIGGNMRLKALSELGYKEIPCKVLPKDTSIEKLKAYTIKDNIGYGEHEWDSLRDQWDVDQLDEWGLDIPGIAGPEEEKEEAEPDMSEQFFINIRCDDEKHAQVLYEKFIEEGLDVKIVT